MATVPTSDMEDMMKNMDTSLRTGVSKALNTLAGAGDGTLDLAAKVEKYFKSLKDSADLMKDSKTEEALDKLTSIYKSQKDLIGEIGQVSGLSKKEQSALKDAIKETATEAKDMTKVIDGTKKAMAAMKETMASVNQIGGMLNKSMGDSFTAASALKGAMAGVAFATGDIKGGVIATLEASEMMIEGIGKVQSGFRDTALAIVTAGVSDNIKQDFDKTKGFVSTAIQEMNADFAETAESTERIMMELSGVGFKNLNVDMVAATRELYLMGKSLNMSTSQVASMAGTLTKEFGYTWNQSKNIIMSVAEASKNANVTQAEYAQTLISTADRLKDYNVSWKDIDKNMKDATEKGLGWSRSVAYATEMSSGLARQDLGRRAFMSRELGFGQGDILGAAAMRKYEPGSDDTRKFLEKMLEKTGGSASEITRLKGGSIEDREKAFGMAQKAAMASGLDERVVMEALGLVKQKQDPTLEEMKGVNNKLSSMGKMYSDALTTNEQMKKLGRMADYATSSIGITISDKDKSVLALSREMKELQAKILAKESELEKEKSSKTNIFHTQENKEANIAALEFELESLDTKKENLEKKIKETKHSGGEIRKFHGGGEVPAILESGEFVINKRASQEIGYDTLSRMNSGGSAGGNTFNVNVDLNVNRLKELVNMWFEETFRNGMRSFR